MQSQTKPYAMRSTMPLFFYPMFHPTKDLLANHDVDLFCDKLNGRCENNKKGELYVHIPFCDSFCHMCACYKTHTPRNREHLREYIKFLKREIDFYSKTNYVQSLDIECVYFGGGTPSTLTPDLIHELITYTKDSFNIKSQAEITFEGDVRTLKDEERLSVLRKVGCSRISFGVQTLDPRSRKLTGLVPSLQEIKECIENLSKYDYKINFDLMFGLPGQTFDVWKKDLSMALDLGVEGLDIYEFVLYPTTKLFQFRHRLEMADEDTRITMLRYANDLLNEKGFIQKSKAIHEKAGNEFKMLKLEYDYPDIVAIGDSAIGYLNNFAYRNYSPLPFYMSWEENIRLPMRLGIELNQEDRYIKMIEVLPKYLQINKKKYHNAINYFTKIIDGLKDRNLVKEDGDYIKLTDLGRLWADDIHLEFIPSQKKQRLWKIVY